MVRMEEKCLFLLDLRSCIKMIIDMDKLIIYLEALQDVVKSA